MALTKPMWFDKQGKPLKMGEWARLFEHTEYRRVERTVFINNAEISTIWVGIHFSAHKDPYLFETSIWHPNAKRWDTVAKYKTLEDAKKGHAAKVKEMQETYALAPVAHVKGPDERPK